MDQLRMDQDPARAEALAALSQGPLAAAVAQGAPALVLTVGPARLVRANAAACFLFGSRDEEGLALRIAAGQEPAFARLLQLNRSLRPGAAGRVEKLRCPVDGREEQIPFTVMRIAGTRALLIAVATTLAGRAHTPGDPLPEASIIIPDAPAPVTPVAPAAKPVKPEELTADFARRFDGAPFVRFLWQTDAQNVITSLTGQFCDVIQRPASAIIGQDLAAATVRAGADPEGLLAGALARRETWSNLSLNWPIAGTKAAVPVVFGGLPTFDANKNFAGFRGFGVIHLQKLVAGEPPVETVVEALPDHPPEPEQSVVEEPTPAPKAEVTVLKPQEPAPSTNVVPLRPGRPVPVPPPAQPLKAADLPSAPRTPNMLELSPSERNAFREIARALGARIDDRGEATPATPPTLPASDIPKANEPPPELPTVQEQVASDLPVNPRVRDLIEIASRQQGLIHETPVEPIEPTVFEAPAELEDPQALFDLEFDVAGETHPEDVEAEAAAVAVPSFDAALEGVIDRHARPLLDRMPIGILISRLEVPIYLNKTLLDLLGYADADEFHAAGGLEAMFRGRSPEHLADAASGGAIPLVTHAGEIVPVEARVQAIDWDGDPATMLCLRPSREAETLTRLRNAEQDLRGRDTEIRELHAILDTATDGVAILDEDGLLLSFNRAAQALFGYEQNELVGKSFTTLLLADSHQRATDYLAGLKSSGVASVMNDGREVDGRARQGGVIPLFMTLGRITAGGSSKFCAVLRDITSWKKAERELNEARKQAERASSLKSDFLAKVSHEIRTPLNAILGFAEVIIEERFGPIGNERYKDYLKDIHASGTHVMSLVNDLLDLSKIEAGRLELNFGAVDANKIVSECVSLMQPQANRERVIIRMSLAQRLPNIVADERSLRQIVLNLLSNAVKFNEPGGQVIVSTALTDAGHAVIRIRDTGIGMTEAEAQLALEPFRQLATSRVSGGTGLGLPLTKALVEANRASFTIKSKKKEGTLIEVAFPPTRVLAE